jgi:nucleoside-diphosphate-sugar epimerase
MKTILICGATGFIGKNLVHYYSSNNYNVIATYNIKMPYETNKNVKWIKANLTKEEDVKKIFNNVDIMIQAAATTSGAKDIVSKPYIHTTDNAVMNSLLFREAFHNNIKHVIFFSCTVMLQSSDIPQTEDDFDASLPINEKYFGVAHTKLYLEKMCQFYSSISQTKFTAIRHSNIYGQYDKFDLEKSHVFGATVTKVMSAKDKITVWGTGEEARDLLYVDDLMSLVDLALCRQKENYLLLNCGYGESIKIKDLIKKIIKHSGKEISIEYDKTKPTIKTSLSLNCSKAKKYLGWTRQTKLDDGIKKTIIWWKENINH